MGRTFNGQQNVILPHIIMDHIAPMQKAECVENASEDAKRGVCPRPLCRQRAHIGRGALFSIPCCLNVTTADQMNVVELKNVPMRMTLQRPGFISEGEGLLNCRVGGSLYGM